MSTSVLAEGGTWYTGIQAGAAFNDTKFTGRTATEGGGASKSNVSIPVGLHLGWMCGLVNDFLFATDLAAFYDFSGTTQAIYGIGAVTETAKITKQWSLELMPKIGYRVNQTVVPYIGVGFTGTRFKFNSQAGSTNTFALGLAPAVGIMFRQNEKWSSAFEYKYQMHQEIKETGTFNGATLISKAEPRAHVLSLKLNFNLT